MGHLDQKLVACLVAEAVVDALEAVEVQEQERDRCGTPSRSRDCEVQPVEHQVSVGQAGQRVVERLARESGLGALARDRVADRPAQSFAIRLRLEQVVLRAPVERVRGER